MTEKHSRKQQQLPETPIIQPSDLQLLSINQTMKLLGLGRTKIYDLINNHGLPTARIGRTTRIPVTRLRIWIEQRETTKSA